MSTTMNRAGATVDSELKRLRWAVGVNGALSIALGVAILVWPNISLLALTIVFGAYAFATGVMALAGAFRAQKGERGWLIVSGLLGLVTGVLVLVWPDISALALLYVIGAYAIALGVIAIGGAYWLPMSGGDTAVMTLSGVVSIVFGIVIFAKPGAGALVTLALIAAFALVTGSAQVILAVGGKRLIERDLERAVAQPSH
jgi:uncharacterized membrane protein HdeD (DUF308 family)